MKPSLAHRQRDAVLTAALDYARACADQEEHRRSLPVDDEVIAAAWWNRWRALCRDTAIKGQALLAEAKRLEDRPTGPEVLK
jgi:hypothetical protein